MLAQLLFVRAGVLVRVIQAGQEAGEGYCHRHSSFRHTDHRSAWRDPRLLARFPFALRIPGRIIGLGVRRERVRSPLD